MQAVQTFPQARSMHRLAPLWAALCLAVGCTREPDAQPPPARAAALAELPAARAPRACPDADGDAPRIEREFRDRIVGASLAQLKAIASEPAIVAAVLESNRANRQTQAEILRKDRQWRETSNPEDPLIRPYLTNACAQRLQALHLAHAEYVELFVMDSKGCIVGESSRTSDYWQGDEAKWIRSFNAGQGQTFVDEIEYDDSTQSYLVQVSLPVLSAAGETIGAVTVGIQTRKSR